MPSTSINITYTGVTSSFVPSAPIQRQNIFNTNNPKYLRYASLTQDSLTLIYYTQSVVIPMSQLYQAAYSASPSLTYPPVISQQPSASQTITHSNAAYFTISASAESPITYQWYSQSFGSPTWLPLTSSGYFTGSATPSLTQSNVVLGTSGSSFECVATNTSGNTTSSIGVLYSI